MMAEGHSLLNFTYLHILETVLLADTSQYILFAAFLHFPSQQQFIQDKVCFLKVENDVQLTDIAVIFIHLLDVAMDDLKCYEFVVR
jgi:hypothetical protein